MNIVTPKQAQAAGYRSLTNPYQLPRERGMLERVLADMRRGNIAHVLVRQTSGLSVWRRGLVDAEIFAQSRKGAKDQGQRTEDRRQRSEGGIEFRAS